MRKLFGTDGIRGKAYDFLSFDLGKTLGYALGTVLEQYAHSGKVVIGKDTRVSGEMLTEAVYSGLALKGFDVYDVGVVPTPLIAYLTETDNFDAGIMISASHNPYEYNGIKIFGKGGFKLSDSDEEKIEELMESLTPTDEGKLGSLISMPELKDSYIKRLSSFCKPGKQLSVVIDCANGSAVATADKIFSAYGINIQYIGCEPNGKNINLGVGSTNLEVLKERVVASGADLGLAFDGDADRCLAVDDLGNEVDGDHIMAILALALREDNSLSKNTVVGTVMTNYGFNKFALENGIEFIQVAVGDRYILMKMEEEKLSLGAEQSGHVIIRDAATTGDGQLTAIYLLNRIITTGQSLSTLASVLKKYPQYMININADKDEKSKYKASVEAKQLILNAEEKLKGHGRILVRPSGTESLIRIMVESDIDDLAERTCQSVATELKKIISL